MLLVWKEMKGMHTAIVVILYQQQLVRQIPFQSCMTQFCLLV